MKNRDALRKHVLAFWKAGEKERTIQVQGSSMRPFIEQGNAISFTPSAAFDLHIGDIAVFEDQGMLIAHRIVDRIFQDNRIWFKEKGDNRFYPTLVTEDKMIGKVTRIAKQEIVLDLTKNYWIFINRLLGYYWKVLFTLLDFFPKARTKLLNVEDTDFVTKVFRRLIYILIKLPVRLFRSRQI